MTTPALPDPAEENGRGRAGALERLASFRFTYLAFVCFVALYLVSVAFLEKALQAHFLESLTYQANLELETDAVVKSFGDRGTQVFLGVWGLVGLGAGIALLVAGG